jgi:hypothetical protein
LIQPCFSTYSHPLQIFDIVDPRTLPEIGVVRRATRIHASFAQFLLHSASIRRNVAALNGTTHNTIFTLAAMTRVDPTTALIYFRLRYVTVDPAHSVEYVIVAHRADRVGDLAAAWFKVLFRVPEVQMGNAECQLSVDGVVLDWAMSLVLVAGKTVLSCKDVGVHTSGDENGGQSA